MYHAPLAERTDAWKPSGVVSARTVAVGSSMPRPRVGLDLRMRGGEPGLHDRGLLHREALHAAVRRGQRECLGAARAARLRSPTFGAAVRSAF